MSHLFMNTTRAGTPTWRARRMCSRVWGIGPSAALTTSELDDVPGLGPARKATLLRHFGSVRRIAGASVAEIAGLPGIGPRIAETVAAALHPGGSGGPADAENPGPPGGNGGGAP